MSEVTAFAPATVANVAVGFDLLGFAFPVIGDEVTLKLAKPTGVRITRIEWQGRALGQLTTEPEKNTATLGLIKLLQDLQIKDGVEVIIRKGIPLGSGMGGSAASAVAAIVAANHLFSANLSLEQQVGYALLGEAFASGGAHADNVAPCLFGGMTLARSCSPVDILRVPVPRGLWAVVAHPALALETKKARGVLEKTVTLQNHIRQSASLAGVLLGCVQQDFALIGRSLADVIIEPQRQHLIPGFAAVKAAALAGGALGCSISGAGPSVFAWATSEEAAHAIGASMEGAFTKAGVTACHWAAPLGGEGARCL